MKGFIFGLVAALGFSSIASADCGDDAAKLSEQKGFAIRDTPIVEELDLPNDGEVKGYRAWLRVAQCNKGYVIVNMYETCLTMDIWAQGGCDVPEVQQALRNHN